MNVIVTLFASREESGVLVRYITPDEDEYHKITVFAFFDGTDLDCKSSNYDARNLSISLDFEGALGTRDEIVP